ncbi:MAG: fatty acid--CoA ligase family protein, partial [Desulfobacteraceae bacterium]|nr:fatty acid--CoA ligase family protein [Desulfobacteraceae bacterium]
KKRQPAVTLGFLQFDHIGGINTLLHSLSSGGTLVIGEDRSVPEICRIIEQYRVELLPTTPTFIKMLAMSGLHREYDLSSLKLITYGTEPMPQAILEVASRLFPHVTFKQTYGLTETGILPTKSKDSASLGMKVGQGDCDVKVENGILHVRASTMMMGYLNEFAPIDSDGWYNTGDVVESMEEGYFHILGRESEIINVAGEKVFPGEVENVILKMDNIRDVTVRGAPNPVTGNVVVAEVELAHPEDEDRLEGRVRSHCGDMLPPYMIPVMVTVSSERLYGSRFKKIRRDGMKKGESGVGSG